MRWTQADAEVNGRHKCSQKTRDRETFEESERGRESEVIDGAPNNWHLKRVTKKVLFSSDEFL